MSAPATMRVMPTDPATQGPFVVINAADFDPAVHQPYAEPAQDTEQAPEPAAARRRGRPPVTAPNT